MMISKKTPNYHFSPTLQEWAVCDAQVRCRLDHISEAEYVDHKNSLAEEKALIDSKIGEAEIAYIGAKTDLSIDEIHETLKELRREGSQLPAPTVTELKAFIEQERFKVENDPTLTKKEKRAILKSLREAEKELEKNQKQITGGVFHAWKNGLLAALAKVRKPILVGALAGGLAFGLAACAPNNAGTPDSSPKKDDKETVQVVEECDTDAVIATGDVIAGEQQENSAGEYCSVVIDPNSSALVYDNSKVDKELYDLGYTDEQLENIQKQAVNFAVQAQIDNPTLGLSREDNAAWIQSEGPRLFKEELVDAYVNTTESQVGFSGADIAFRTTKMLPPLIHDGGTRSTQVVIEVERIQVRTLSGDEMGSGASETEDAEVVLKTTTSYRVTPDKEAYRAWRIAGYQRYTQDDPTITQEQIDEVTETEINAIDWAAPVYRDVETTTNVGYTKEDIIAGESSMKVRSAQTVFPDIGYWSVRN